MVSSSKILTVSYGTFSCTAEGFDDPLEVVKDATHFFRGVVREDRFFGAEPPQFDPELAAELLLSQMSAEAGQGKLTLGDPASAPAFSTGRAGMQPAVPAGESGPQASAAAKAVAEMAAERASDEPKVAVSYQGDGSEDDLDAARKAEDTIAALLADEAFEDSLEDEPLFGEVEAELPAAPKPGVGLSDPDSVAAKLRRIRAVVAQGAPADAEAEPEDDETDASVSALLADEESARDDTDGATQSLHDSLFTETDATAAFDEVFEDDVEEDSASDDAVLEAQAALSEPQSAPTEPRARVIKVKRAAFDTAPGAGLAAAAAASSLSPEDEDDLSRELAAVRAELQEDFDADWDDEDARETVDGDRDEDAAAEDLAAELGTDAGLAAAVGAAMFRQDGDEAWDDADEWDDEEDGTPDRGDDSTAPLRLQTSDAARQEDWDENGDSTVQFEFSEIFEEDEDGANLAAEAQREDSELRTAHQEVRKAVKMSSPARAMLTERSVEDNDASRILDETNTQLQEPEGNRRRSAIAHLRAAVAATRADKLLGRKRDALEQAEPYRADLANVVRPRRPEVLTGQTERPVEVTRPAPLKLVAEQRVDPETPAPAPRPRRVRLADIDEPVAISAGEGDDGFVDYAESVGARDLPELLEAAAAYMSFVEHREQFSRPQLMTKVRQVETEESSREDRLRSFGQLLREGKIEKTSGGRFTASDRISFKPDARAAS
ncbi:hypothetical protein [Salipiger bermudensis]|uniref:hypothetical protein n=1 Tax=Salipiger bermudensis TaxID=344736 RepID=UPI001CD36322|nr:hypothetical protein [Salipiger bermudensis]MCA0961498.1 hypothetical protein [Salipiger bermudensis]